MQGAPLVRLLLHPENLYHNQIHLHYLNYHPAQKLYMYHKRYPLIIKVMTEKEEAKFDI